jgi:hypothetical protein
MCSRAPEKTPGVSDPRYAVTTRRPSGLFECTASLPGGGLLDSLYVV